MKPEKEVIGAVETAQRILGEYIQPGPRDCEQTIDNLMDVLDSNPVNEAVDEIKDGRSGEERRSASLDIPMPEEKRPQDPSMDGRDMRFEGYTIETQEHAGEYPDTMPQLIEVTDAEGNKAAYVPLSKDGKVVDSSNILQRLKDCEQSSWLAA
jgi:hypothetical protein